MKEESFYTKLTLEHKYPDDFGPQTASVNKVVWDISLDSIFDMFHGLVITDGFSEEAWRVQLVEQVRALGYEVYKPEEGNPL